MGSLPVTTSSMKSLFLITFLALTVLLPIAHSFFLGPIAVGAAVGALFVAKGLFLGAALSSQRSRTQSHGSGRSYSYQPRRHYETRRNTKYTKTKAYYYSSESYSSSSSRRGKREAMEITPEELARFKREIQESFDSGAWYLEMVEKDQDDCTKRLICEMAARQARGRLQGVEADLAQAFGLGNSVDVSSPKAIFDMAAQSGKLMGKKRCEEFYKRCDTPVDDIIKMVNTELVEFTALEQEIENNNNPVALVEAKMEKEREDLAKELGIAKEQVWA